MEDAFTQSNVKGLYTVQKSGSVFFFLQQTLLKVVKSNRKDICDPGAQKQSPVAQVYL